MTWIQAPQTPESCASHGYCSLDIKDRETCLNTSSCEGEKCNRCTKLGMCVLNETKRNTLCEEQYMWSIEGCIDLNITTEHECHGNRHWIPEPSTKEDCESEKICKMGYTSKVSERNRIPSTYNLMDEKDCKNCGGWMVQLNEWIQVCSVS